MGTKKLENILWSVKDANTKMKQQHQPAYWAFLVKQLNYNDVKWDEQLKSIVFPEFIPLKSLFEDLFLRISGEEIAVSQCQKCEDYFNINNDEGIFGDSDNFTNFLCKSCAMNLSSWEFYHQFLVV